MEDRMPYITLLRTIDTKEPSKAIAQEYGYLSYRFGERGVDWKLVKQMLIKHPEPNGSKTPVDVFQIQLADGKKEEVWIDISSFFKG